LHCAHDAPEPADYRVAPATHRPRIRLADRAADRILPSGSWVGTAIARVRVEGVISG
jgi:hypothetical protein